jgi:hypothetical protein
MRMGSQFNPQDWYWQIASVSTTLVYSSARNIYVDPTTDVDYGNWVTDTGLNPYAAQDETEVWYYTQQFQPAWYYDTTTDMMSQPAAGQWYKGQLNNYNATVRFNKVNAGMTAAGIPTKTDDYTRNLLQGGMLQAQQDPSFTAQWFGSDGNWYSVDAETMIEMATTVGTHTNNCFTVFYGVGQDIIANTVTQPSQIDAAYVGL